MDRLVQFMEKVAYTGNVVCDPPEMTVDFWDAVVKKMYSSTNSKELMVYGPPSFIEKCSEMLERRVIESGENVVKREFKSKINSWSFLIELSFNRGGFDIHFAPSHVKDAVVVPTFSEDLWGEKYLAMKSILIITELNLKIGNE